MYIHLMEMSPHPELALRHGDRLSTAVPDAGHLIHLATHIDVLCGDYLNLVARTAPAIAADRRCLANAGPESFYTVYRCHNYHSHIYGAMFWGQPTPALTVALANLCRIAEAEAERERFLAARDAVQETRMLFNGTCRDILKIAQAMLEGELAYHKGNPDAAFAHLRRAVELDDTLAYDEP